MNEATATAAARRRVEAAFDENVMADLLREGQTLPLVIRQAAEGIRLAEWAAANRAKLETLLLVHGGILFRGFGVAGAEEFESVIRAVAGEPLEYRERSSPRSEVHGHIYTSTDYPAKKSISLHNENSYQQTWPAKLFFHCATAAQEGGETPLAECRRVLSRISPAVRERFTRKGWMYVRNFGDGFGLPWQVVFQTSDKAAVERQCRESRIAVEWKDDERLRTRAVSPAVARHPRTGEHVWFNHAAFFHVSSLEPGIREALLDEFEEDDLPSNTFYGDGSSIEPEVMDELREAYRRETVAFPWHEGDVLMLDNMLVAHGRAPFVGPRKVLVGMAQPVRREETLV